MTAISIGSSLMSFAGGQQAAADQQAATNASTQSMYDQTAVKQQEINDKYAMDEAERKKQGMIDRAQSVTTAGESGALGFTMDRLLGDSFMQEGLDMMSMETNRTNAIKQTEAENKSYQAKGNAANVTAQNQAPSLLGTGLTIAGDYAKYDAKVKAKTA